MKRRLWSIASVLILALAFTIPAQAAAEYGLIYDETEMLYSDELEAIGTEILPAFLETYDIDLRVDILTSMGDFTDVAEAAEYLYTEYGYGGSEGNGASLTLLTSEDVDGVALEDWHIYFGGTDRDWTENASQCIPDTVYDLLSEDAWAGDLEQDIKSLTAAISGMVEGLEEFLLTGSVPTAGIDSPSDQGPQLDNVTDEAGLLTEVEWQELERQARAISEQYGVGVYAVTVKDYLDYTNGDIYDAADEIYHGYTLGLGEDRDGILLILSMARRDYLLIAYGDSAQYAFNDDGMFYLEDFFLDDFGNDDWYNGFAEYLTWSADYLENAKNGTPYSDDHVPMSDSDRTIGILIRVAIILLVPLVIAGTHILILISKMNSVAKAVEASTYLSGDLHLTRDSDRYTHTTETRRKIEKKESSSGSSSGGGSGRSGKF